MADKILTPEDHATLHGEPEQVVHIDFAPKKIGNPRYDELTGIETPYEPTGCITAAQAQAAANAWEARRRRDFESILQAETEQRDDLTEADMIDRKRRHTEASMQFVVSDLYRLQRRIGTLNKGDVEALLSSLNHLHLQCGSVLRAIEDLAGRKFVPPHLSYNSLDLNNMGGYEVDPRTGQRMCPFSHYRDPWPRTKDA